MSTRPAHRLARLTTGVLAVTAIAAPAAGARPAAEELPGASTPATPDTQVQAEAPRATVTRTIDDGFDLPSAAIGAGGAGIVLLIAAAGATAVSRHHTHVRLLP